MTDRTGLASMLLLGEGESRRVWFGIQGERVDSDLSPIDAEVRRAFVRSLGLAEAANWPQLKQRIEESSREQPWHHWAAAAAVLCLLAEMLLQRKFI